MKQIIIGLDLSFNSTGITASYFEDWKHKYLSFHKLMFDDNSRVYKWIPNPIENIDIQTYQMPTNISPVEFSLEEDYEMVNDIKRQYTDYAFEQTTATVKAMICSKRIGKIISTIIEDWNADEVYFNIEGWVTPTMFTSSNQMRVICELIMLQGLVREFIIKYRLSSEKVFKKYVMMITPPTQLKKFFTGFGNADKQMMIKTFMNNWQGTKLIRQDITQKIDDIVDSFALMIYSRVKIEESLKKKNKLSPKNTTSNNIIML